MEKKVKTEAAGALTDRYGRTVNYLRVSVTDRRNMRCIYCMPQSNFTQLPHEKILKYEEILRIVKAGAMLGISKVRVTGGEPLVRKGIYDFLSRLNSIDGIEDLSLTTNGVLLKDNIERLVSTGIKRINISIDTLSREKFKKITKRDYFQNVLDGIEMAYVKGLSPIKLNVVVLKGKNDEELEAFAKLTFEYPVQIRFIEYMPVGVFHMDNSFYMSASEIIGQISSLGHLNPVARRQINDGPALYYKFNGAKGEIGLIAAMSHKFCKGCNRLRLTADGIIKPYLLSDLQVDLKSSLRSGCNDAEIAKILLKAVLMKPGAHDLDVFHPDCIVQQMHAIGG